jgi:hypothetical protein
MKNLELQISSVEAKVNSLQGLSVDLANKEATVLRLDLIIHKYQKQKIS